jgi:phosphonoacetaldehyde hydrolase
MQRLFKRSFSTGVWTSHNKIHINSSSVMNKVNQSKYRGPVHSVILGWSGTTIDRFVNSFVVPMKETFEHFDVPITDAQVRQPMGVHKREHLKTIALDPQVKSMWNKVHNRQMNDNDLDLLFHVYSQRQMECLGNPEMTTLLPFVKTSVDRLRNNLGVKIGSTSGFLGVIQRVILDAAIKQGQRMKWPAADRTLKACGPI